MHRARTTITKKNAKEIYQYFEKAIQEKRIFGDDLKKLTEAKQAFFELTSTHDADIDFSDIQGLQLWVNTYIPFDKWKRCLATLRQIRSNKRHSVRSLKLNCETYVLLKNYANHCQVNMQTAIHNAIKPLYDQVILGTESVAISQQHQSVQTKASEDGATSSTQTIQLGLRLYVQNNSKFVRGKKKALEDIEICLEDYDIQKVEGKNYEYILTIEYETDEELDEIVYGIYDEMSSEADMRYCFIEADIFTLDGARSW